MEQVSLTAGLCIALFCQRSDEVPFGAELGPHLPHRGQPDDSEQAGSSGITNLGESLYELAANYLFAGSNSGKRGVFKGNFDCIPTHPAKILCNLD